MAKINPRDALEVLTRARLIELAQGFELDVKKSSSKDELIDALLRKERGRAARFEKVLEVLGRAELKEIDKGKEKAGIVARILGREEEEGGMTSSSHWRWRRPKSRERAGLANLRGYQVANSL